MKYRGSLVSLLTLTFICIIALSQSAAAYYYPGTNVPPGPPPNYNPVDTNLFKGTPILPTPPPDSGGYFIYWDQGQWNIVGHIFSIGNSLEQFHGSILAIMDSQPELGVNVFIEEFEHWGDTLNPLCLDQNDRWGWVDWGDGLYEIWWDVTTKELKTTGQDLNDKIKVSLIGCAVDFNLWSSGHDRAFDESLVFLGENMVRLSEVEGFIDTYEGITDDYQSQAGNDPQGDPNITIFTRKDMPGASYNMFGVIDSSASFPCDPDYGLRYTGAFAYESNGIEFSVDCLPIMNHPPSIKLNKLVPGDSTLIYCVSTEFCFEVSATDADTADLITLSMLEGPAQFDPISGVGYVADTVCFTPPATGNYLFVFQVEDSYGNVAVDSINYYLELNSPVTIDDQQFAAEFCYDVEPRELPLVVNNPDGDQVMFMMLSGPGTIDPATGVISYTPDTAGTYTWVIDASDSCGFDQATITDIITINQPPTLQPADTLITLCEPGEVCLDLYAFDPEGTSVLITLQDGAGQISQTGSNTGQLCFTPTTTDSATYQFIFCLFDVCPTGSMSASTLNCVEDTVTITIVIDKAPTIFCPPDVEFFTCDVDTFCFDINASDPELSPLTINVLSGNAWVDGFEVCVVGSENDQFEVMLEAVDTCGHADTCSVGVTISGNRPPSVTTADDFAISLCQPDLVCFPASVSDPDLNLESWSVSYGEFNDQTGQICFNADTTGIYEITFTAFDSCGAENSATTYVTVEMNQLPVVALGPDFTVDLCAPEDICVDVDITDDNLKLVNTNIGVYNEQSGQVCFYPTEAGQYELIVSVYDDCEEMAADTILIDVTFSDPSSLSLPDDFSLVLCAPEEICVDITRLGTAYPLTTNLGSFNGDSTQVCFTAELSATYALIVTGSDSCGAELADTVEIDVDLNVAPIVADLPDTAVYLCEPGYICLPVSATDADGNLASITTNVGQIKDGEVCFVPYAAGQYELIITATDSCGLVDADTALIDIRTDQDINLICPNDTTLFACEVDTFCLPIAGVPADAQVDVTGINAWFNADNQTICFYSECSTNNHITVSVTTACGTYECDFTARVECNNPPVVLLPPDTSITICEPTEICLPAGVTDFNGNLASVVSNFGSFNDATSEFCFTADTSGVYQLELFATDSCGEIDADTVWVTVIENSAPVCIVPNDTTIVQCEPTEVRLPVSATDIDDNFLRCAVVDGPGTIVDGDWIYTPVGTGSFTVTIRCIDECGLTCESSFDVSFDVNNAPVASCSSDTTIFLCDLEELCLRPFSATDADGNLDSAYSPDGVWFNDTICFTPVEGENILRFIAVDECGLADTCTTTVTVVLNSAPICNIPSDTTIFVCNDNDEICIPIDVTDVDGNWVECVLVDGIGRIVYPSAASKSSGISMSAANNQALWCFNVPADSSQVTATIRCVDDCGAVCESQITVNLDKNSPPIIEIPPLDPLFLCDAGEVCIPGFNVYDPDGNLDSIAVFGGTLNGDTLCFAVSETDLSHTFSIVAYDSCGAETGKYDQTIDINFNQPPVCNLPGDSTIDLCGPVEVSLPISATDPDGNLVGCELIDSPGEIVDGNWVYTGSTSEQVTVTVRCTDECGAICEGSFTITFVGNNPPTLESSDSSFFLCDVDTSLSYDVAPYASDADGDPLAFTLTSNYGSITPEGLLTFDADTIGTYTFQVEVSDSCATGNGTVTVFVDRNRPPELMARDTVVNLCVPEEICFDVFASDPDSAAFGLQSLTMISGYGNFNLLSDSSGQVCFTPQNLDSADYRFIFCASDSCNAGSECVEDTVNVTVIINRAPVITCPEIITTFICADDPVCFDISATDYENGQLLYNVLSGNASIEGTTVCLTEPIEGQQFVSVEVVDDCGLADTCEVEINLTINQPPVITLPPDNQAYLCTSGEVCVQFDVLDPDNNIDQITSNLGSVSDKLICFNADTAGFYSLILTAIDSCGVMDSDTIEVDVTVNELPIVTLGDDFDLSLCQNTEVCVELSVIDDNAVDTIITGGTLNESTGEICFTTDGNGVYTIIAQVEDACGEIAADTVEISVNIAEPPTVDLGESRSFFLCDIEEICVDVATIANYDSLYTSLGSYNPDTKQVCFTPEVEGEYILNVQVFDSCGLSGSDEITIDISFNSGPVMTAMPDTSVYLCTPAAVCLPLNVSDADGNIVSITTNFGTYENGEFCFIPYSSGEYQAIVTAIDDCGAVAADTAMITVQTDQAIEIECPNDTTIFMCDLDTVCFPIAGIPTNGEVTVSGVNTWWDAETQSVCFYSDCALTNHVRIDVTTECGTYSCTFDVRINCNREPLIALPPDTVIVLCEPGELCLPIAASDFDNNLTSVTVEGATYIPGSGEFCLNLDTVGTYHVYATAVDSCGATAEDHLFITVEDNVGPSVIFGDVDSVYTQCVPEEICIDLDFVDSNDNLKRTLVTFGQYNEETGQVCFTPDTNGVYCIKAIALDECNLTDTAEVCIRVETANYAAIDCPADIFEFNLCDTGQICVPLAIEGNYDSVVVNYGSYDIDGFVCFSADTSGQYSLNVKAYAECNTDECNLRVDVAILDPVEISCPGDQNVFLCDVDTVCFDITASSTVSEISVTPPAYMSEGQVCLPVLLPGEYTVVMVASGFCGVDSCLFNVNATFNTAPTLALMTDTTVVACDTPQVCIPFDTADVDGNIVSVTTDRGTVEDGQVCFQPDDYGIYNITLTVEDECGLKATRTVKVTLKRGAEASILGPPDQFVTLCEADSVCIAAPVSPYEAEVRVLPAGSYNPETGEVCIWVDQSGTTDIMIIADAMCSSDTASFKLQVDLAEPPAIICPSQIDTLLCLASPTDLCFPVTATGTGITVSVNNGGSYSGNVVCVPIGEAGTYDIQIIAEGICGADTCMTTINVEADQAPTLTLPSMITVERCDYDTAAIIIDGIYASDIEDGVDLISTCGPGTFTLAPGRSDSGAVMFYPDGFGDYEFCFEASDSCSITDGSFLVVVNEKPDCDVCVRLSIESGDCTPVGLQKNAQLMIETNKPIGGFDVLLSYDATAIAFQDGNIVGTEIDGWEYFVYRLNSAACGDACPSGLVRFIGLADVNNGAVHPPVETLSPQGLFINMQFLVANDQNLSDQFVPIRFVWYDCGDNTFSDPTGNDLFVDYRIYNYAGSIEWDEADDATYPEEARPFGYGSPDSCFIGTEKSVPERCVEFMHGGICVIHADSIDARGDINLNNVAYEIADVVVFSNYFIYGLAAFTQNVAGQIAASDVNADGVTLSVADLVYLIRVVIGDADPIPKLVPYTDELLLTTERRGDRMIVTSDAVGGIGGAYLVFDIEGDVTLDDVVPASDIGSMNLISLENDGQLRVLLYSISTDRLQAGKNELMEIPFSGNGQLVLSHTEFVDYQGRPYQVAAKNELLPTAYELNQNYPNPFNPSTIISFSLPIAADWHLTIYNIAGAMVQRYDGFNEAGRVEVEWNGRNESGASVASGVYLYRLETADFRATKKMILLK